MKGSTLTQNSAVCCRPKLAHVKIYFDQRGLPQKAAEVFFKHYESCRWKTEKGNPISNWKTVANNWIWMHQQRPKPQTLEIKLRLVVPQNSSDAR